MSRGIHTKPNNGYTNDWLTPPHIIRRLGKFDLDPCAHPKQFNQTAKTMISPPDDGLAIPWSGRVWLNPPYGQQISKWMEKMAAHNNGIALVPARTEVESWFWPYVWEAAHSVFFLRGRIYFYTPDGTTKGNAGHGSVLVAYGADNTKTVSKSGIVGRIIVL